MENQIEIKLSTADGKVQGRVILDPGAITKIEKVVTGGSNRAAVHLSSAFFHCDLEPATHAQILRAQADALEAKAVSEERAGDAIR